MCNDATFILIICVVFSFSLFFFCCCSILRVTCLKKIKSNATHFHYLSLICSIYIPIPLQPPFNFHFCFSLPVITIHKPYVMPLFISLKYLPFQLVYTFVYRLCFSISCSIFLLKIENEKKSTAVKKKIHTYTHEAIQKNEIKKL